MVWSCIPGSCASWWGCCPGYTMKSTPRYLLVNTRICLFHMTDLLSSSGPSSFSLCLCPQYPALAEPPLQSASCWEQQRVWDPWLNSAHFPRSFQRSTCWWLDLIKTTAKQKPNEVIEPSWGKCYRQHQEFLGLKVLCSSYTHPSPGCWQWSWLVRWCKTCRNNQRISVHGACLCAGDWELFSADSLNK